MNRHIGVLLVLLMAAGAWGAGVTRIRNSQPKDEWETNALWDAATAPTNADTALFTDTSKSVVNTTATFKYVRNLWIKSGFNDTIFNSKYLAFTPLSGDTVIRMDYGLGAWKIINTSTAASIQIRPAINGKFYLSKINNFSSTSVGDFGIVVVGVNDTLNQTDSVILRGNKLSAYVANANGFCVWNTNNNYLQFNKLNYCGGQNAGQSSRLVILNLGSSTVVCSSFVDAYPGYLTMNMQTAKMYSFGSWTNNVLYTINTGTSRTIFCPASAATLTSAGKWFGTVVDSCNPTNTYRLNLADSLRDSIDFIIKGTAANATDTVFDQAGKAIYTYRDYSNELTRGVIKRGGRYYIGRDYYSAGGSTIANDTSSFTFTGAIGGGYDHQITANGTKINRVILRDLGKSLTVNDSVYTTKMSADTGALVIGASGKLRADTLEVLDSIDGSGLIYITKRSVQYAGSQSTVSGTIYLEGATPDSCYGSYNNLTLNSDGTWKFGSSLYLYGNLKLLKGRFEPADTLHMMRFADSSADSAILVKPFYVGGDTSRIASFAKIRYAPGFKMIFNRTGRQVLYLNGTACPPFVVKKGSKLTIKN